MTTHSSNEFLPTKETWSDESGEWISWRETGLKFTVSCTGGEFGAVTRQVLNQIGLGITETMWR